MEHGLDVAGGGEGALFAAPIVIVPHEPPFVITFHGFHEGQESHVRLDFGTGEVESNLPDSAAKALMVEVLHEAWRQWRMQAS